MCGAGVLLTAVTLIVFGDHVALRALLAGVMPLAWVGAVTAVAGWRRESLPAHTLRWLWLIVVIGAITNIAIPLATRGASLSTFVPVIDVPGIDFREGLYKPGLAFSNELSIWPPFTLVVGWLFARLGATLGYAAHLVLLLVAAAASVMMSSDLVSRVVPSARGEERHILRGRVLALTGFWFAVSYGLIFELERGNANLYALAFSLLCVVLVLKYPESAWFPAIALAIAVNLKVYPAVLAVLLLWRYRWRALLPLIATNLVLLLVTGPKNAILFLEGLRAFGAKPFLWAGNHSAAGFAFTLSDTFGISSPWIESLLLLVPILLWAATAAVIMRSGWSEPKAVILSAACFPLMNVIPSVGHDYKLILTLLPLSVLGAFFLSAPEAHDWRRNAIFACLGLGLVMIGRSTLLIAPTALASKYPLIVLLQVLLLCALYVFRKADREEAE